MGEQRGGSEAEQARRAESTATWHGLLFVLRMLNYTRVPSLTVLAGAVILGLVPQGHDVAVGVLSGPVQRAVAFYLAALFLSISCWAYGRVMLSDRFGMYERLAGQSLPKGGGAFKGQARCEPSSDPELQQLGLWACRLLDHYPRCLSLLVWVGAALAIHMAHPFHGLVVLFLLTGIGLYGLYMYRRHQELLSTLTSPRAAGLARKLSLFGALCVLIGFGIFRVALPQFLGSAAVLYLLLSGWNAVLSQLVYSRRASGFNYVVFTASGLYVLTGVLVGVVGDNHELRRTAAPDRPPLLPVAAAYDQWEQTACPVDGVRPLVLVASAGGGLRAAFWTTRVLTAFQDRVPAFSRQVFALSGASGGAFGAMLWVAWDAAADPSKAPEAACLEVGEGEREWRQVAPLFDVDYLAPAIAGLVGPDFLQRFIPLPMIPDRATDLEQGWEWGFAQAARRPESGRAVAAAGLLGSPFLNLWSEGTTSRAWRPLVLLNGTRQQTGARIITSPLRLPGDDFPGAYSVYDLLAGNRDLPISTAIHNAARFPFVSPSGSLAPGAGHVIDGGYAENLGAQSALDLLHLLAKGTGSASAARGGDQSAASARDGEQVSEHGERLGREAQVTAALTERLPVRPIIIQITNDAQLPLDYLVRGLPEPRGDYQCKFPGAGADDAFRDCAGLFNDVGGPLLGVLSASPAAARLAGSNLQRWTLDYSQDAFNLPAAGPAPIHVHFRLYQTENQMDPAPLGWVLSEESRAAMDWQLRCCDHNRQAFAQVVEALTGEQGVLPQGDCGNEPLADCAWTGAASAQ